MTINMHTVSYTNYNNQPSFKAAIPHSMSCSTVAATVTKAPNLFQRMMVGPKKVYNAFVEDVLAKRVIAPLTNKIASGKTLDKTAKMEGMTDHMATVGSVVTTATYAGTTLANKKLEKKPARTLALNQFLVMILSTIGAYTINDGIANATKKMSYQFINANRHLPEAVLNKRLSGFKAAQKLMTFTLMYRYVSPVIVTPAASKISKALSNHNPAPIDN